MAQPPPLVPITIPAAIADLTTQITHIRRKNKILIDYHIYPNPTPSELLAHEPRLAILVARLASLGKLSYPNNGKTGNLSYIIDDPEAFAAWSLNEIVDQLLNAIHGFVEIFHERYDPSLKESKPFGTIYETLLYREKQLKYLIQLGQVPIPGQDPEDHRPNSSVYFCKGAVALINRRDKGRLSLVTPNQLSREQKVSLSTLGGAYLFWDCPSCDYRVPFHVATSTSSTIHNNDEVLSHPDADVEYRTIFLAKSHTFSEIGGEREVEVATRRPSSWGGRRRSGNVRFVQDLNGGPQYGCLFCFGEGKELSWRKETIFRTARDLAEHISDNHRTTKKLPPSLMLQKLSVAVNGRVSEGLKRWELNMK